MRQYVESVVLVHLMSDAGILLLFQWTPSPTETWKKSCYFKWILGPKLSFIDLAVVTISLTDTTFDIWDWMKLRALSECFATVMLLYKSTITFLKTENVSTCSDEVAWTRRKATTGNYIFSNNVVESTVSRVSADYEILVGSVVVL